MNDTVTGPTVVRRLGPWTLGEHLGGGAFGDVYAATHDDQVQVAAIKVLKPHLRARAEVVKRFLREARAAAELDHPGICRCSGADQAGEYVFLVLELLQGVPLSRADTTDHDRRQVLQWFVEAARALAHAHSRGVVHRDIKPENFFIREDTKALVMLDLGIARTAFALADETILTQVGTVMGTRPYIAPEVWSHDHGDWFPADIYALGVTFFQLYEGQHPRASRFEVGRANNWEHIVRRRAALARSAPTSVADLLDRMLAVEPAARPTAASVVAELEAAAALPDDERCAADDPPLAFLLQSEGGSTTITMPPEVAPVPPAFTAGRGAALGDALASVLDAMIGALCLRAEGEVPGVLTELEDGYRPLLAMLVGDLEAALGGIEGGRLAAHFLVRGPTARTAERVRVAARSTPAARRVYDLADDQQTVMLPLVRRAFQVGLAADHDVVPDVHAEARRGGRLECPRFEAALRDDEVVRSRYGSVLVICLRYRSEQDPMIPGWGVGASAPPSGERRRADAVLCLESPIAGRWDPDIGRRLLSVALPYTVVLARSLVAYARVGKQADYLWRSVRR